MANLVDSTAPPRRGRSIALVVLAVAVVLAACTGETSTVAPESSGDDVVPATAVEPGERPEATPGEGNPPTEVLVEELVTADGPRVDDDTQVVTVHVLGHGWESGVVITSSWDRGAPRTLDLDGMIEGFQRGIEGMAVGDRRRIVVPAEFGYGDDRPAQLEGDEPIVFVVDLLGIG